MKRSLTIGIVGSGGDGVVVLGSFLQRLAAAQGYFSQMPRYYGAQIRGGGSAVKFALDTKGLSLPKDNLDILVCFNWEKYLDFENELPLGVDTLVLYENDPPKGINLPQKSLKLSWQTLPEKSSHIGGSIYLIIRRVTFPVNSKSGHSARLI